MSADLGAPTVDRRTETGYDDEVSLAAVGVLLLGSRRTLLKAVLIGGALGVLFAVLSRPDFKSSASFISQDASASASGLAGLASQFGFAIPGSGGAETPQFYQELLTSREVLTSVVSRSYDLPNDDGAGAEQVSLLDLLDVRGDTPAERLDRGIEEVQKDVVSSDVSRESNVVSLSVTTHWPEISEQVASALLDAMQSFNLRTRRSQAQAEREFLDGRVAASKADLQAAEDSLQGFLQQNRQFSNSPELQFRYDRLQRGVTMRQGVYSGLMEAYEQARIREVRDTPVITVLEYPIVPPRREPRGTVLDGLLGMILGGMIGLGIAFVRHVSQNQDDDPEAQALQREWAATKEDLRRLVPGRRRA